MASPTTEVDGTLRLSLLNWSGSGAVPTKDDGNEIGQASISAPIISSNVFNWTRPKVTLDEQGAAFVATSWDATGGTYLVFDNVRIVTIVHPNPGTCREYHMHTAKKSMM